MLLGVAVGHEVGVQAASVRVNVVREVAQERVLLGQALDSGL